MTARTFSEADLAYIGANYLTLAELCAKRPETPEQVEPLIEQERFPRPSYVLDDGTGMFPADYFRLVDAAGGPRALRAHFEGRHRAASLAEGANPRDAEQDWKAYMNGAYGVCLREVTPENIVRKSVLVASLSQLLTLASPRSRDWRAALRAGVEELDALEREFAPDYDRNDDRERLPTRDLLIKAARKRYPDVFANTTTPSGKPETTE
ncbi:MAG TPA: DUF6058 family natural product biosynthesis protein [Gaiellaceae bacterium]|nr:DUF6058 family natural product biosynthesis protein [Gaiellaceae bacterium]